MEVTVTNVLTQMSYVIPTIIVASMTLTSAIQGIFNIKTSWVNHLISWLISVATALGFVALNGLTFGLGNWDYLVGGICGLIAGSSSNGVYDWEMIKKFFDAFANLFGKKTM